MRLRLAWVDVPVKEVFRARRPASVAVMVLVGSVSVLGIMQAFPGSAAWGLVALVVLAVTAGGIAVVFRHRVVVEADGVQVRYLRRDSIRFADLRAVRRRTTPGHNELHYDWVLEGTERTVILPSMEKFHAHDRARLAAILQERAPDPAVAAQAGDLVAPPTHSSLRER